MLDNMGFSGLSSGGGSAASGRNTSHMQALLSNDLRAQQYRFEEAQANKLGALDTLLKEDRRRQQQAREVLLGTSEGMLGSKSKRARIPSSHFNSTMPLGLSSSSSPTNDLALSPLPAQASIHGVKPLRGAEALPAKSARERREEEEEVARITSQIERNFLLPFRPNAGKANNGGSRPNTAPDGATAASSAAAANNVSKRGAGGRFVLNAGLDADFLTSGGSSGGGGGSKKLQRKVTSDRSAAHSAANQALQDFQRMHAATPENGMASSSSLRGPRPTSRPASALLLYASAVLHSDLAGSPSPPRAPPSSPLVPSSFGLHKRESCARIVPKFEFKDGEDVV